MKTSFTIFHRLASCMYTSFISGTHFKLRTDPSSSRSSAHANLSFCLNGLQAKNGFSMKHHVCRVCPGRGWSFILSSRLLAHGGRPFDTSASVNPSLCSTNDKRSLENFGTVIVVRVRGVDWFALDRCSLLSRACVRACVHACVCVCVCADDGAMIVTLP
jgi:hypothetical protein